MPYRGKLIERNTSPIYGMQWWLSSKGISLILSIHISFQYLWLIPSMIHLNINWTLRGKSVSVTGSNASQYSISDFFLSWRLLTKFTSLECPWTLKQIFQAYVSHHQIKAQRIRSWRSDMMLDAIDVSFFPVSPAMLLRDVKSWVACRDNRVSTQAHQGNQPCYLNATSVLPERRYGWSNPKHSNQH
jgi:hypothetical protein